MTNAQIINLKKELRFDFWMEQVLATFGEEVWENNSYGEEYENLTKENFIKYFADAMLNPTKDEEAEDEDEVEDEEDVEDDEDMLYCAYKCNGCNYTTQDDDPDCVNCKKTGCMMAYMVKDEEKPMCVECGVKRCVDLEDKICHTCYHESCEEGECYCQVNMDEDDDVKCEECWTCEGKATNQVWRDALNEYEHTCDACHRNEYPEEYENEE